MVENHEKAEAAIAKLDYAATTALKLYGDFARALCTNAIHKAPRGQCWQYKDADGLEQELASYEPGDRRGKYYEYYLFEAFRSLQDAARDHISATASAFFANGSKTVSDEEYDAAKARAKALAATLSGQMGSLAKEHSKVVDGDRKYGIYKELASMMQQIANTM
jgi:hypothetical protein